MPEAHGSAVRPVQRLSAYLAAPSPERLSTADERRLAGLANGVLWIAGGLSAALMAVLPGGDIDATAVAGVAMVAVAWGASQLAALARGRSPLALPHVSSVVGLAAVAALSAATGGSGSPAEVYLWFVVVYSAFFYPPRQAVAYWVASLAVLALPLAYDADAVTDNVVRNLLVHLAVYPVVGGVIIAGRELLSDAGRRAAEAEGEQRRLAAVQSSLRRVATAVAAGVPPHAVFALVSAEAARLLGADAAAIMRFEPGDRVTMMGNYAISGPQALSLPGQVVAITPEDELWELRHRGIAVRVDDHPPDSQSHTHRLGFRSHLSAPIHTGSALWGALVLTAQAPRAFPSGTEEHLQDFADLIATAVATAEDRNRLGVIAGTDRLTGLSNARAFSDRIDEEASRAGRHGRSLTVAILDVDRFRQVNDRAGTEVGDGVLREVAERLRTSVRDEDVVARLAGDDFGVLFVESDPGDALAAIERARREVADAAFRHGIRLTISGGLCALRGFAGADELLGAAEAALRRAKALGGDRTSVHDPSNARDLPHRARSDTPDRSEALAGLRALARAIDAKHPATRGHSERVAMLAARLAALRGWTEHDAERLRQAALLHDVGKIGVPDAILLKPGRLTSEEYAVMRDHAALGATIATDALDPEQAEWIRGHHERPDGGGYPRGLAGAEIAEGAALLAVADAWDVMTRSRWYTQPMADDQALAECHSLAGMQFTAEAVAALEALDARGELRVFAAGLERAAGVA